MNDRPASFNDIPVLIMLCRDGFADSVRWQSTKNFAAKIWRQILGSAYCQTQLFETNGKPIGFVTIVTEPKEYHRQKSQYRPGHLKALWACMRKPAILLARVREILLSSNNSDQPSKDHHPCIWLEFITVAKPFRRKGLAADMLVFVENFARSLNREIIKLSVKKNNVPAINLYQKAGYTVSSETANRCILMKHINQ